MNKKIKTLVLIDDDNDTNIYNEFIISVTGMVDNIIIFQNGKTALEFLTSKDKEGNYPQPEIIFLDINMPIMNGWEFLTEYKKTPETQRSGIVITMLSSSMNPDDKLKAAEMDIISGFVNKPLTEEKFKALITRFFLN